MLYIKLNIQRFGVSASKSTELISPLGRRNNYATLDVSFTENNIDVAGNFSSITVRGLITQQLGAFSTSSNHTLRIYWHDNRNNVDVELSSRVVRSLNRNNAVEVSANYNAVHNDDGNLSGYAWARWDKASSNQYVPDSGSAQTDNIALTYIPRYTNISSFNFQSATETSATFNWNATDNVDAVQYSLNGSEWTGTSGTTFSIYGLNASTGYSLRIRVKRADSQLWTESGTIQFSTYDYPHPTSCSNANIGQVFIVNVYNPLGRTYSLEIIGNNNTTLGTYDGSINGNVSGFNDETTINNMYKSIPNAINGTYTAKVTYGDIVKSGGSGTYSIDNSDGSLNPTFDSSYWTYITDLTDLTGNDTKTIIKDNSTITFKVTKSASAKKYATINQYVMKIGDISSSINDISLSNSFDKITSKILSVTAVDSRGYMTESTIEVPDDNYANYVSPVLSLTGLRENAVGTNVFVDGTIKLFSDKFGTKGIYDSLEKLTYAVSKDNKTYTSEISIPITNLSKYNNTNYTIKDYQIYSDGKNAGFDFGVKYYVKFKAMDKLRNVTATVTITTGEIVEDIIKDSNGYHIGINGLANSKYAEQINGSLNILGKIYKNGIELVNGGNSGSGESTSLYTISSNDLDNTSTIYSGLRQAVQQGKIIHLIVTGASTNIINHYFSTGATLNSNNVAITFVGENLVFTETISSTSFSDSTYDLETLNALQESIDKIVKEDYSTKIDNKQNKLTAGSNITISEDNIISASYDDTQIKKDISDIKSTLNTKADSSNLPNMNNYYTKSQVDSAISTAINNIINGDEVNY